MRPEPSSIRNPQGSLVEAAISWVCRCGHPAGAAGHREPGAGAAPKVLSTTCAKAAGRAGVVSQVTQLQVAAFAIQGCCSSMFLLKDVLGKECLSRVLADKLLYWQQYFFAFGNTLGMARKRGGAGFRGGVGAGAVSPWSLFLPGAAPQRAHPCPALPSSGKSRHCSRLGSRRASGGCFVAAAFYSDHSTAGMAAATWGGICEIRERWLCHLSPPSVPGCICRGDSGWGEGGSDT